MQKILRNQIIQVPQDYILFWLEFLFRDYIGPIPSEELRAISSPRPSTHAIISSWELPPWNLCPGSHWALSVNSSRFDALDPMPLLPEVQKGTIVFPEKS